MVEISYFEEETIKIVKNHFKDIDDEKIKFYIKKYGNKPRYILDDLESKTLKHKDLKNPESIKSIGKPGK